MDGIHYTGIDGIPVWTVYRYGRYTGMDGIPVWTVYQYGRYTGMDGIQVWTVYQYGRYTGMDGIPVPYATLPVQKFLEFLRDRSEGELEILLSVRSAKVGTQDNRLNIFNIRGVYSSQQP